MQEWQNSGGTPLASVNASGTIFDASGQVCTASNGLCNQTDEVGTVMDTYLCYGTSGNIVTCNDAGVTYAVGTDVLTLNGGLSVGGTSNSSFDTNTLFIDSTNNKVGIGTSAPTQRLDINGSVNVTGVADGSYTCYMYNPNGGCMLGGNSTCNILFSPDGSLQTAVCN